MADSTTFKFPSEILMKQEYRTKKDIRNKDKEIGVIIWLQSQQSTGAR